MNITNQFQQISVLLTQDRFEAVLQKMTMPTMTPVIANSITGKYPTHDRRNRCRAGTEQEVKMIGEQRPSITRGPAFFQVGSQALQEITPVAVILKYRLAFNVSGNKVMKRPRRIYA
jgi:hypothetical protein